ncbi:MAG: hypothetical protein A2X36_03500 [Elusimicrobia bacterium GWA2_69_24]|nr:MAG: hypothetical protein A2X36_03500 [Elusimicrobia bacterium GWA2_69_24]HBL16406.1 hypothetical protein [Elusimicrobiota bacterium]
MSGDGGRSLGQFGAGCAVLIMASALMPVTSHYPVEKSTRLEVRFKAVPAKDLIPIEKADTKRVYAKARESVVTVLLQADGKDKSQGSGAIIGRDALGAVYVLTNKHVVYHSVRKGEPGFKVKTWNGRSYDAELEFYSRKADLAIMRVLKLPGEAVIVRRDAKTSLEVGDPVFSLGTPAGMEQTLTAGIVSALRPEYIQTDATVTGGSSGSPLLDARGWLCGVITRSHKVKDYSFAIYGDSVVGLMREREALKGLAAVDPAPSLSP